MMLSTYTKYHVQTVGYSLIARILSRRCFGYETIRKQLLGKQGLEIGGPSSIFSAHRLIPIYNIVGAIDSCNFAQRTIWTANDDHIRFGSKLRTQLTADTTDFSDIPDGTYDFVATSHVLEHVANPLRALQEWKRLLKPSGTILMVLPHKAGTFDRRRPFTTFDHIRADYESGMTEADLTHLREILELHDLQLDPSAGSPEEFQARCLQNFSNRAIHHHVFSPELLTEMFSFLSILVLNIAVERPYHIIMFAQKLEDHTQNHVRPKNAALLSEYAEWRKRDPFHVKSNNMVA